MTDKDKSNYLKIALALAGIVVNLKTSELIWRTVDGLNEKKGNFNLKDYVDIEVKVTGKLSKKEIKAVPSSPTRSK